MGEEGMKDRICFVSMYLIVTSAVYLFIFSGCKVGPDYVRPEYSVPDQWHQKAVQGLEDGSADLQTWWKVFNDPVLEDLIQRSGIENLNLKIAYARVMESRALLGVAAGQYWPDVDAVGDYSRSRPSENGTLADLPAKLLRQRLDIRRAERISAAETADIGIVIAALYPAFSLSGTFALETSAFTFFLDYSGQFYIRL
jgi:outer membrane protein TolC